MQSALAIWHLGIFCYSTPLFFHSVLVGKDEISSIVRVNMMNSSSSSVTKTSKCLNERARFKRLHDFEMHSPRRQAVENAHIAFDVTSSNFYVKSSHQVRTTGRKGWIRCNPMDWQGRHLLISSTSLPVLASIAQPKSFLNRGLALQNPKFFAQSVKHMRTAHVTFP